MDLDEAIAELRRRNEPVPRPTRLPTETELRDAEAKLGVAFHPDYRRFLLEASDVSFSALEPATISDPGAHTHLFHIVQSARERWRVPQNLLPICEDNADYYCLTEAGKVILWAHEMQAPNGEVWRDLATWIEQVWMIDYDVEPSDSVDRQC